MGIPEHQGDSKEEIQKNEGTYLRWEADSER